MWVNVSADAVCFFLVCAWEGLKTEEAVIRITKKKMRRIDNCMKDQFGSVYINSIQKNILPFVNLSINCKDNLLFRIFLFYSNDKLQTYM